MSTISRSIKGVSIDLGSVHGRDGDGKKLQEKLIDEAKAAGGSRDDIIARVIAAGGSSSDVSAFDASDAKQSNPLDSHALSHSFNLNNAGVKTDSSETTYARANGSVSNIADTTNGVGSNSGDDVLAYNNAQKHVYGDAADLAVGITRDKAAAEIEKIKQELAGDPKYQALLDELAEFGLSEDDINPEFLAHFNAVAGGIRAGTLDPEKSFNPLIEIATTKDGYIVKSLNSFFKLGDIQEGGLDNYARSLDAGDQGKYQWASLSRAWGDLYSEAFTRDGLSKNENLTETSEAIARTAKLFQGSAFEKNALAMSFVVANLAIDEKSAKAMNLDAPLVALAGEQSETLLLSEVLSEQPNLLENPNHFSVVKDLIDEAVKDPSLAHFNTKYDGEKLGNIQGSVDDIVAKSFEREKASIIEKLGQLNEHQGKSPEQLEQLANDIYRPKDSGHIYDYLRANGYGGSTFTKVGNAQAVAQTYMNLKEMNYDLGRLGKQLNIDESSADESNRLFRPDQIAMRLTPNGSDHNGAFNEYNIGRQKMSIAGMNRDLLAQFVFPENGKAEFKEKLQGMKDLGLQLSYYDESLHGYQQGTSSFSNSDSDVHRLLNDVAAAGAEITLNSCSCGAGTANGADSYAINILRDAVENKGVQVHAATVSTMGYTEHAFYDAKTGQFALAPVKLDGATGGITITAPDEQNLAANRALKVAQHSSYLRAAGSQENYAKDETQSTNDHSGSQVAASAREDSQVEVAENIIAQAQQYHPNINIRVNGNSIASNGKVPVYDAVLAGDQDAENTKPAYEAVRLDDSSDENDEVAAQADDKDPEIPEQEKEPALV